MNLVFASRQISKAFPSAAVSVSCSANTDYPTTVIVIVMDYKEERYFDSISLTEGELTLSPSKLELRLARKVNEFINKIGGENASSQSIN